MTDLLKKLRELGVISVQEKSKTWIHSGSYALNKVISGDYTKGYPIPGIVEISGESSSGKSIFLAHLFREAQKLGYYTKLEDAEGTWNDDFNKGFGVDPTKLLKNSDLNTLEDTFDSIFKTIMAIREENLTTPIIVGLDSLPVLPVKEEFEKSIKNEFESSQTLGMIRSKAVGNCLRNLHGLAYKHNVLFVIINQLRSKMAMFGSPDTRAAGGRSLEYYLTVGLKTIFSKHSGIIEDDNKFPKGIEGRVVNTKNKISIPYLECDFSLDYMRGLDPLHGLLPWLVNDGRVIQTGAWYSFEDKKFHAKEFPLLLQSEPKFSSLISWKS